MTTYSSYLSGAQPLDQATRDSYWAQADDQARRLGISREQALYNIAQQHSISNADVDTYMGFGAGTTDNWLKQRDAANAVTHPNTAAAQPAPQGHSYTPPTVQTAAAQQAAAQVTNGLTTGQIEEARRWSTGRNAAEIAAKAKEVGLSADQLGSIFGASGDTVRNDFGYGTAGGYNGAGSNRVFEGAQWVDASRGNGTTATFNGGRGLTTDEQAAGREWAMGRNVGDIVARATELGLSADQLGSVFGMTGDDVRRMTGYGTQGGYTGYNRNYVSTGAGFMAPATAATTQGTALQATPGGAPWLMDEYYNQQYPWLVNGLNTATRNAYGAGDAFNTAGARAMEDYDATFRPSYQKLSAFVDKFNDPTYRGSMRGQAMEGADAQFNAQDDALRRRFQGMGAGSGALADALASNASARAMAKVQAATQSDNNLDQMYGNGLSGMANLGLKVGEFGNTNYKNAVASFSAPLTWGNEVFKTGGSLSAIDSQSKLGLLGAMNQDYANRQGAGVNWYNAQSNRIQANNGTLNAQTNAQQAADANDLSNQITGTVIGAGISGFLDPKNTSWGLSSWGSGLPKQVTSTEMPR